MQEGVGMKCPDTAGTCEYSTVCPAVSGRYRSRIANELDPEERVPYVELLRSAGILVHTELRTPEQVQNFGRPCVRPLGEYYGIDANIPGQAEWLREHVTFLGHGVNSGNYGIVSTESNREGNQ